MAATRPGHPASTEHVTVRVVEDVEELEALRQAWDDLARKCTLPTALHAWTMAAARTIAAERRLRVVVAERGGVLVAAAPLAESERGGDFELLGAREMHEPVDFLFETPDALDPLVRWLARSGETLSLQRLPAASPTVALLRRAQRARGVFAIRPAAPCPYVDLDQWREAPTLNSRRRSDLRRAARRAAEHGEVSVSLMSPGPGAAPSLLREAIEIEARSWRAQAGTALVQDEGRRAFFEDFCERCAHDGTLRIDLMRLGRQAVAMQIVLAHADSHWVFKIAFDESFSRCSPGLLLLKEAIDAAARAGLRTYELLGNPAPWIDAWTREKREMVAGRSYRGLRGIAHLGSDLTTEARNRLSRQG